MTTTEVKSHEFDNGSKLVLEIETGFADMRGVDVYSICYLSHEPAYDEDNPGAMCFQSCNSERFLDRDLALRAFEARLNLGNPYVWSNVPGDIEGDWQTNMLKRQTHRDAMWSPGADEPAPSPGM